MVAHPNQFCNPQSGARINNIVLKKVTIYVSDRHKILYMTS